MIQKKKWLVSCVMHSFHTVLINSAAKLSRKLDSRYEKTPTSEGVCDDTVTAVKSETMTPELQHVTDKI